MNVRQGADMSPTNSVFQFAVVLLCGALSGLFAEQAAINLWAALHGPYAIEVYTDGAPSRMTVGFVLALMTAAPVWIACGPEPRPRGPRPNIKLPRTRSDD